MAEPNFLTIHQTDVRCQDILLKTTNVNLMVVLESGDHQRFIVWES